MQNISDCIANACKDTIDPNDKDGSYDLCLSRPDTVRSLCKVQIDPCEAAEPDIMKFVTQRLAGMRVNECTNQIKNCLQNDNRCGKDYQNCIGMDVDSLMDMCPEDLLTACADGDTKKSMKSADVRKYIIGIFMNIDNTMLDQCQKLANQKIIEVCGGTDSCAAFDDDDIIGTESLLKYTDNDNNYVIEGLISFGNISIVPNVASGSTDVGIFGEDTKGNINLGAYKINIAGYAGHMDDTDAAAARVVTALQSTANKISQKVAILVNDPKVQMCTTGRDKARATGDKSATGNTAARYPRLLDSAIIMIANAGLDRANKNYMKKYNDLVAEALESQNDSIKAATCAAFARSGKTSECTTDAEGKTTCQYYNTPYADLFSSVANAGVSGDMYKTKYVIKGADLQKSMEIASSGKGEFIQTDTFGNMMGRVSISAVYSADKNTCTLTTTTTMCKNAEAVITTDTDCYYSGVSIGAGGVGGCNNAKGKAGGSGGIGITGSSGSVTTVEHYAGNVCTEFRAPEVTTQAIKM